MSPEPDLEHNKDVVAQIWQELDQRDFDAVGAHFHDDGEYTDVPSPADDVGATGSPAGGTTGTCRR
jgi:ketosteroid isomerase-like protein